MGDFGDPFWSGHTHHNNSLDMEMADVPAFADFAPAPNTQLGFSTDFLDLNQWPLVPAQLVSHYGDTGSLHWNTNLIPSPSFQYYRPDPSSNYITSTANAASEQSAAAHNELGFDLDDELRQLFETSITTPAAAQPSKREKKKLGGYPCIHNECARVFNRRCDLRKHMQAHLPESARPLPCPGCLKRFCDAKDLNRHVTSQHPQFVIPGPSTKGSTTSKRRRLLSPERIPNLCLSAHQTRAPIVKLINKPCGRYREPPSYSHARSDFEVLSQLITGLRLETKHARSSSQPYPGEMVAFRGRLVLVTTRQLSLGLSSYYNSGSNFKLRSMVVPRQRKKIEEGVARYIRRPPQGMIKMVFVREGEIVVRDTSSVETLHQMLAMLMCSMNIGCGDLQLATPSAVSGGKTLSRKLTTTRLPSMLSVMFSIAHSLASSVCKSLHNLAHHIAELYVQGAARSCFLANGPDQSVELEMLYWSSHALRRMLFLLLEWGCADTILCEAPHSTSSGHQLERQLVDVCSNLVIDLLDFQYDVSAFDSG